MADTPPPFVIEEIAPGGERIELRDSDVPYGRPRTQPAFTEGVTVALAEEEGTYLPGRKGAIYQVLYTKEHPLEIRGCLRDAQWGVIGHARGFKDRLLRMARRANLVKVRWWEQEWTGFLDRAECPIEGPYDVGYSLRILISVPPEGNAAVSQTRAQQNVDTAIFDSMVQIAADIRASQAGNWIDDALAAVQNVEDTIRAAGSAAAYVVDSVDHLPANIAHRIGRFLDSVRGAMAAARSARLLFQSTTPETLANQIGIRAMPSALDLTLFWNAQFGVCEIMRQIEADLWRQANAARATLTTGTQLYRVATGDTLDTIAQAKLGSRARASEITVKPSQLVPGNLIRIPAGGA